MTHIASDHDLQIAADIRMAGRIIAFCGDSFCANIDSVQYPTYLYLLEEQGANIILTGTPGNPLYHSYMSLLEVIDKADYIVFCITEPGRLPNKDSLPICYGSVAKEFQFTIDSVPWTDYFSIPRSKLIKIMNSARDYYKDVMSQHYHEMAQKGIVMQIDELMVQKQKKCIWFPCFDTSLQEYKIVSGPCGTTPLMTIAKRNKLLIPHSNHFSEEQNKNMFTLLKNIINNDTLESINLNMDMI